ncbi:MFS transporter [Paenibacillus sp. KN14-4R]|uniref:MFS transporter n=1 Tax=Paenibacillus sp. KN14-4R TaxID=3445773 RepID=UPI003FA0DCAE
MRYRDFHRNVKLRIWLSFMNNMIRNMVLPFMAIYFADRLGASIAGVLIVSFIVIGLICSIIGGYLSDRIGRRQLMIQAEVAMLVGYIGMMMFNSPWFHSAWITFAMMLVVSAAGGIHTPASQAMLVDVTEPHTRKYMYQMLYWLRNIAGAIAAIIGAYLFKDYFFELLIGLCLATMISIIITVVFIQESYFPKKDQGNQKQSGFLHQMSQMGKSYAAVLKDTTFVIFIISSMLIGSVEFHLTNYVGVRLSQEITEASIFSWGSLNWTVDGIRMMGLLQSENTVLIGLFSILMGYILKKYNEKRIVFIGFTLYVLGYSYIAYSNSPWMLILAMLIATIGELFFVPVKQAYFSYITPDHARSSYMAVNEMSFQVAMFIAGAMVSLGSVLSSVMMASIICISGIVGIFLFALILPKLDDKRDAMIASSSQGISA